MPQIQVYLKENHLVIYDWTATGSCNFPHTGLLSYRTLYNKHKAVLINMQHEPKDRSGKQVMYLSFLHCNIIIFIDVGLALLGGFPQAHSFSHHLLLFCQQEVVWSLVVTKWPDCDIFTAVYFFGGGGQFVNEVSCTLKDASRAKGRWGERKSWRYLKGFLS